MAQGISGYHRGGGETTRYNFEAKTLVEFHENVKHFLNVLREDSVRGTTGEWIMSDLNALAELVTSEKCNVRQMYQCYTTIRTLGGKILTLQSEAANALINEHARDSRKSKWRLELAGQLIKSS